MGGRGAGSGRNGKTLTRETRNILSASPSNILGGKTGTEKQEAYAGKLLEQNKNALIRRIENRKKVFERYNQRLKESEGKSEKGKALFDRVSKASLKSELKEANKEIKRYTQRLKKAKRQKTLGQVISVLS